MTIRVLLQSIEKGAILVDNAERYVPVGRGVVIYVAFLGDVDDAALEQAVAALMSGILLRRSLPGGAPMTSTVSLNDCPDADILVVPQASLGGKLKGHRVQFHALVEKSRGLWLYDRFCQLLRAARGIDASSVDANGVAAKEAVASPAFPQGGRVINGTYGNRQGLKIESEGPLTHFLDL
ncbi:Chain A, Structural Analysis Of A Probable Eukaryotic D-Amino Acid Trna Deacylase [Trypanosoma conorhini]|uniref:Chain A, Structural Analysis Of A Probable Eukaryotic D-Amino Acid Trna Deacylase n=1 Tax=Trypanosoma conorhini TaxID=83891 RepID=A0A3R7PJ59_9TRYP|nr:Chain A, Structural Analysis Of A Probable Eukaryotic D-Amino Acid Trna Deacylase [Trypanosoma conorhini]RNF20764.1 Chain A, Structural Analysis Of A Probable Eukaryotic D-Amino Acid Trna Deacylase [Trypanosoma conorhini]